MKTWFDFNTQQWVSNKPKRYWTGLICIQTKEKIFIGDTISINFPITRCRQQIKVREGGYPNVQDLNPILIHH